MASYAKKIYDYKLAVIEIILLSMAYLESKFGGGGGALSRGSDVIKRCYEINELNLLFRGPEH